MDHVLLSEIHYFRMPVKNLEESIVWYQQILGLQIRMTEEHLAVLSLQTGPLLALVKADGNSSGHFTINGKPEFSVAFTTPDIEKLYNYLVISGVVVEPIQMDNGHSYFCFYDPSGNKLQVHN